MNFYRLNIRLNILLNQDFKFNLKPSPVPRPNHPYQNFGELNDLNFFLFLSGLARLFAHHYKYYLLA